MRLRRLFPKSTVMVAVVFLAASLRAQQPLPVSTQARLSLRSHLKTLTQRDFAELSAKAQSGIEKRNTRWHWYTSKIEWSPETLLRRGIGCSSLPNKVTCPRKKGWARFT